LRTIEWLWGDKMFPERLRFLREQKNIPQKELGKMFNLSKQTISAYERGETSPSIDTVVLFADFFGVTTDFLLGKQTEAVEEEGLFYNLSEEEKRAVRGHADSYRYRKKLPKDACSEPSGLTNTDKEGIKPQLKRGYPGKKGKNRKTGS
jgi:transcriptional regulator with XRE-family HTH domain